MSGDRIEGGLPIGDRNDGGAPEWDPAADLAIVEGASGVAGHVSGSDDEVVARLAAGVPESEDGDLRFLHGPAARLASVARRAPQQLPADALPRLNALALHPHPGVRSSIVEALFALRDPSSMNALRTLYRVQVRLPEDRRVRPALLNAALRRCSRWTGPDEPRVVLALRRPRLALLVHEAVAGFAPPFSIGAVHGGAPETTRRRTRAGTAAPTAMPTASPTASPTATPLATDRGGDVEQWARGAAGFVEVTDLRTVTPRPDDVIVVQREALTERDVEALRAMMTPPQRRVLVVTYETMPFKKVPIAGLETLEHRRVAYARTDAHGRVVAWVRAALAGDRGPAWIDARPAWGDDVLPGAGQIMAQSLRRWTGIAWPGPLGRAQGDPDHEVAVCVIDPGAALRLHDEAAARGYRLVGTRDPAELLDERRPVAIVQRAMLDADEWRAFVMLALERIRSGRPLPWLAIATSGESRDAHEPWLDLHRMPVEYLPVRSFALGRWLAGALECQGPLYL